MQRVLEGERERVKFKAKEFHISLRSNATPTKTTTENHKDTQAKLAIGHAHISLKTR